MQYISKTKRATCGHRADKHVRKGPQKDVEVNRCTLMSLTTSPWVRPVTLTALISKIRSAVLAPPTEAGPLSSTAWASETR